MMIASGQQRRARRRAERGGVEARIAQTHFRQSIHIRRGNLSTKSAPLSEASVIDQNEQDIRSAGGSFSEHHRSRLGIFVGAPNLSVSESLLRLRQVILRQHAMR